MLTIYTKEKCPSCSATIKTAERLGIPYQLIPTTKAMTEEFKEEGFLSLPIVKTRTDTWSGFRIEKLKEYRDERDL